MITKIFAFICKICPLCIYARNGKSDVFSRFMRWHGKWCPIWKSYEKIYGKKILLIIFISISCFASSECRESYISIAELIKQKTEVTELPNGNYEIVTPDEIIFYENHPKGGFKVKRYSKNQDGVLSLISESFSKEPPVSTNLIRKRNAKLTELRGYVKKHLKIASLDEQTLNSARDEISRTLPSLDVAEKEEVAIYVSFIRSKKVLDSVKTIFKRNFNGNPQGNTLFKKLIFGQKRWEDTVGTEEEMLFAECFLGSLNALRNRGYNQLIEPVIKKILTDLGI